MILLKISIMFCLTAILIIFLKKKLFLTNFTGEKHQLLTNTENVPLIGGVIVFISFILDFNSSSLNFYIFCFLILLIGVVSDLKKINSPELRFLIQTAIIIIFISIKEIQINPIRVNLIDSQLSNLYFNILFTTFCVLVIVNGTNFIDGVNTSAIGYYLIISLIIKYLIINEYNINLYFNLDYLILVLLLLYCFNLFNKLYLGDNGAYILGIVFSLALINLYNSNIDISPFYIVLLLWYPAFENLFSIFRKIYLKSLPTNSDTLHLHQLIFRFLNKFLPKKMNRISNSLTGNLINFYNLIIMCVATMDINSSKYQIFLIIFNIMIYILLYRKLNEKLIKLF
jgi:UDP-N-acetylmuramyl pentapeptide phosphotransferase/UDP-N-acetylglucosamine-1-phosphate transferase